MFPFLCTLISAILTYRMFPPPPHPANEDVIQRIGFFGYLALLYLSVWLPTTIELHRMTLVAIPFVLPVLVWLLVLVRDRPWDPSNCMLRVVIVAFATFFITLIPIIIASFTQPPDANAKESTIALHDDSKLAFGLSFTFCLIMGIIIVYRFNQPVRDQFNTFMNLVLGYHEL